MRPSETPGRQPSPLKQARLALDLRLCDVAEKAGCSISLVSTVESGYVPPLARQDSIAAAVNASSGSFWPQGTP